MIQVIGEFVVINMDVVKDFIMINMDQWLGLVGMFLICILYVKGR